MCMFAFTARRVVQYLHRLFGQRTFRRRESAQYRIGGERIQARAQAFVIEVLPGRMASHTKGHEQRRKSDSLHGCSPPVAGVPLPASVCNCAFSRARVSALSRALPRRDFTDASSLSASDSWTKRDASS